jgi:hypothetical protein
MESYMAKVDYVGLWDYKIHFEGLPQDSKVLVGCFPLLSILKGEVGDKF